MSRVKELMIVDYEEQVRLDYLEFLDYIEDIECINENRYLQEMEDISE